MLRSDITFPAFLAVLQMASSSRFVDLSEDDIIKFCDEQENKNTTKRMINDIAIFEEFLSAIYNSSEDREIPDIPPKELQPNIKNCALHFISFQNSVPNVLEQLMDQPVYNYTETRGTELTSRVAALILKREQNNFNAVIEKM
jgi:hypothetical protein